MGVYSGISAVHAHLIYSIHTMSPELKLGFVLENIGVGPAPTSILLVPPHNYMFPSDCRHFSIYRSYFFVFNAFQTLTKSLQPKERVKQAVIPPLSPPPPVPGFFHGLS